jgi:hypothetical protein
MATRHHKKGKGGTRIQKGCSKTYKRGSKHASSNKLRRSSTKRRHQNGGNSVMAGSPWTPSAITAESNVNSQGVAPASSPNHFVFTPTGVSPSFIVPQNSNAIVEAQQTGGGKRRSRVKTARKKAIMVVPGQCGGASGVALLPFDISQTIRDGLYSISNTLNVMNGSPIPTTDPNPTIQPVANTTPLII